MEEVGGKQKGWDERGSGLGETKRREEWRRSAPASHIPSSIIEMHHTMCMGAVNPALPPA